MFRVVAAPPALAAPLLGATPTAPFTLTVGQRNVPATLTLSNQSTGAEATSSWSVTALKSAPSCAAVSTTNCTTPDPGALSTSAAGTGRAGTACAGITFTFGAPDASGVQAITPSAPPVVLGPVGLGSDTCIVDFLLNVLKMPALDADPVLPGRQTQLTGFLSTTSNTGITTNSFRARLTTIVPSRKVSDFDGDARSDIAVYRPAGFWYVQNSSTGTMAVTNWGLQGDIPASADYDADGKTDYATFRPSTAIWYVNLSAGGSMVVNWGLDSDIPMPGDYDGDRKADIAVFRPSSAIWYVRLSAGGSMVINWGLGTDTRQPVTSTVTAEPTSRCSGRRRHCGSSPAAPEARPW